MKEDKEKIKDSEKEEVKTSTGMRDTPNVEGHIPSSSEKSKEKIDLFDIPLFPVYLVVHWDEIMEMIVDE